MAYSVYQEIYSPHSRRSARFLAFWFLLGLVCGLLTGAGMDQGLFSVMRGIESDSLSIVGLIGALLIPFLISVSAFWIDSTFLFPICFVRAFLFAYVHLCLLMCYSFGGQWMRWLLLFSDCMSLPVLYFFWYRRILGYPLRFSNVFGPAALLCGIGCFDFYAVMPLAQLWILQKG